MNVDKVSRIPGKIGEDEEFLSVAIYFNFGGRTILFPDCSQPVFEIKENEDCYPVFCPCGHTYIVTMCGMTQCVRCKRQHPRPKFRITR